MDLVYFVALVGVLIFVHELGHFAWAKFFGVKVLTFSLGFGPRLLGFRIGETEYVFAALPIGGYVKMLGESPYDVVTEAERDRSFDGQPVWRRAIIAFAGPMMNLVLPVVLFFVVSLNETVADPPVIGTVFPDQPADGLLLAGDRFRSIDGEVVETFEDVTRIVGQHPDEPLRLEVERGGETVRVTLVPARARRMRELERVDEVGRIGVIPHHPIGVIGVVSASSVAAASGLRTFDRVVSARGRPIDRFRDLEGVLDTRSLVPVTFLRPVRLTGALGGLVEMELYEPHVATLAPTSGRGDGLLRAGIESADLYVSSVRVGSPLHRLGLLPGDRVVTLDGRPVRLWAAFVLDLQSTPGAEHTLVYRRGTELHQVVFTSPVDGSALEGRARLENEVLGVRNWMPMRVDPPVPIPRPTLHALRAAWEKTGEMISLTVYSVVRLVEGRLAADSIGGPLTIFDVAGGAAREGLLTYLSLMAFVSVNLGLINLLPIPLLDGGHLFFFLLEAVTRRPVSSRVRERAALVGFLLLFLLMLLALKNDVERRWPDLRDRLEDR